MLFGIFYATYQTKIPLIMERAYNTNSNQNYRKIASFFVSLLLVLSVHQTSAFTPNEEKAENTANEMVVAALNSYSFLKPEIHHLNSSSLIHILIHNISQEPMPEHLTIWLIRQQEAKSVAVVSNDEKEFYITESDATPLHQKSKMEKLMQEELRPSSLFNIAGIKGRVLVRFLVNEHGDIEKVNSTIADESLNAFEKKVLHTASRKAFIATSGYWKPALVNGQEVKKWVYLPVDFEFRKNKTVVKL
jgi:hypothetical protein